MTIGTERRPRASPATSRRGGRTSTPRSSGCFPARRLAVDLHRAIRHSLFAGGKRLRPILCLAAAEVLGRAAEDVLEPACGLEMIHTYSLIHDDLPALDNDDLRRGVPTCHVVFGEATAILAGDALLTHGLGVFALYPKGERFAAAKIRVLEAVIEAIGTQGMIGGQVADLEAEKEAAPTAELLAIHENKTGRLIRASLARAGRSCRAPTRRRSTASTPTAARSGSRSRSRTTCSTSSRTRRPSGRPRGKDAAAGKATFPGVWGVERSRQLLAAERGGGGRGGVGAAGRRRRAAGSGALRRRAQVVRAARFLAIVFPVAACMAPAPTSTPEPAPRTTPARRETADRVVAPGEPFELAIGETAEIRGTDERIRFLVGRGRLPVS